MEEMQRRAKQRADMLYAKIDRNKLFRGTVTAKEDRSYMNICFVMADEYKDLEADFLKFATEKGMVGIKGHRSVGGFRASCYNAHTPEWYDERQKGHSAPCACAVQTDSAKYALLH